MASYPTKAPITIDPVNPGQLYVDIVAAPLAPVYAPEAGEIMFVGDGTAAPFLNFSPGVIVLYGSRSHMTHVLGFLDRTGIDALRGSGVWGWTGGAKRETIFGGEPLIPVPKIVQEVDDWISTPPQHAKPQVTEGQLIGQVSASRGRLRWQILNVAGGGFVDPLKWADQNGLPPPQLEATKKPPPPAGGGAGDLVLLALLGYAASELF